MIYELIIGTTTDKKKKLSILEFCIETLNMAHNCDPNYSRL